MPERSCVYSVLDAISSRLAAPGGDVARLSEAERTVWLVASAQQVIDNGGFQYFFELDWPGQPEYGLIVDAYRRVGSIVAAECLERAVQMFPFAAPHRNREERDRFLEAQPEDGAFVGLGNTVCGDVRVWRNLEEYAETHRNALLAAAQQRDAADNT